MRTTRFGCALGAAVAVLLVGCAGGGPPSPTAVPASTAPSPATPPLRDDLTSGTPLQLGSAGHWAIGDEFAFTTGLSPGVVARGLATGEIRWQADFTLHDRWDVQPTLGLSGDRQRLAAVRTVDSGGSAALNLLILDTATGSPVAEHLVTDSTGAWHLDLPPRVLSLDADTLVLADDPESGRQTAVIDLATGTLAWRVDDQATAATTDVVVTRGAGWRRADGTRLWRATAPLGPLLARSPEALVVQQAGRAAWLDPATGEIHATTDPLDDSDSPCAATRDTLACLTAQPTGYDLATGERLWVATEPAYAPLAWRTWLYLWHGDRRGDVLDARTGQVLVADAELPALRYADDDGVLVDADDGYRWVAYPG